MNAKDISIIIPFYDSYINLSHLIQSINDLKDRVYEIIIIDSNQHTLTKSEIISLNSHNRINYIKTKKSYPGKARNIGVKNTSTNWIAFLDIKTQPKVDWIQNSIKKINEKKLNFLGAKRINVNNTNFKRLLSLVSYGANSYRSLAGSFIETKTFYKLGPFIEEVRAGEDQEFLKRIERSFYRYDWCEETLIKYSGVPESLITAIKKYYQYSNHSAYIEAETSQKFIYFFSVLFMVINSFLFISNNEFLRLISGYFFLIISIFYFFFRTFIKPISKGINLSYLLPINFLKILIVSICLDFSKTFGRLFGFFNILINKIIKSKIIYQKKVLLNATFIGYQSSGAKNRFLNLYNCIIKNNPEIDFFIITAKDSFFLDNLNYENIFLIKTNLSSTEPLKRHLKGYFLVKKIINTLLPDLYEQFHLPLITNKKTKTFLTIHDLRYHQYKNLYGFIRRFIFTNIFLTGIKRSEVLVTVSETMKSEILNLFPKILKNTHISVVENGYADSKFEPSSLNFNDLKKKYNINSNYFLTVGIMEKRKNFPLLINAFTKLNKINSNYQLLIVGKPSDDYNNILTTIELNNISNNVKLLTHINDDELQKLYIEASHFIYPSIYEGFGIPILEALKYNKNILLSNLTVFKEITQNSLDYFDPFNEKSILDSLTKALNEQKKKFYKPLLRKDILQYYKYENLYKKYLFYNNV